MRILKDVYIRRLKYIFVPAGYLTLMELTIFFVLRLYSALPFYDFWLELIYVILI